MNRAPVIMGALLVMFLSSACYRTVYTGENLDYMATLNVSQPDERIVSHFRTKVWNHYFLYGLFPTSEMDLADVIRNEVPPGHTVRNLRIHHQASFGNMFVSFLTFSLYTPMTTVVAGDVVQSERSTGGVARGGGNR